MWAGYFKNHCKNDLGADIYIPHTRKVSVVSLEYTRGKSISERVQSHVDDKEDQAKVDELNPTDSSNRLGDNLLFVYWPSELSSLLDNILNSYISNNNENGYSCNGNKHNNILIVPSTTVNTIIKWKFE